MRPFCTACAAQAIGQHRVLELLGEALRRLERDRGRRYAWVAWVRPDVHVPHPLPPLHRLQNSTAWNRDCGGDVDMGRVLARDDAESLLFSGIAAIRSDCGIFRTRACNHANRHTRACNVYASEAEDIVRRALPHNRGCLRAKPLREAACRGDGLRT